MPTSDPGDLHYATHLTLTLLHLIPGCLFLLLGPLQFTTAVRQRWPKFHRISGRIFVLAGLTAAISAIVMNLTFPPVGGLFKSLAVMIFSVWQVITLLIALRAILHKRIAQHKMWMVRAFAVGLSVSTMRAFFIPYYAIYGLPSDFVIGLGMWIGFVSNICIAEWIVMRMRRANARIT